MTAAQSFHRLTAPAGGDCPPLESGDRLTRPEFERRYAAHPHIKKAELIEGLVYVAAPLRFLHHAEPHTRLVTWAGTYAAFTPGVAAGIEPTVRLDLSNELQPDVALILDESVGGQTQFSAEGYLEGSPELVIEIAASSAAIDLGSKRDAYCRNGVPEYLVWQVFENRLDGFYLADGEYKPLQPDGDGIVRSRIFPGLWLPVEALLANRMDTVLEVLQQGLASPEHEAFVERIEAY